jgi:hypothetical protein
VKCPAEVYSDSTRAYSGLPDISYPGGLGAEDWQLMLRMLDIVKRSVPVETTPGEVFGVSEQALRSPYAWTSRKRCAPDATGARKNMRKDKNQSAVRRPLFNIKLWLLCGDRDKAAVSRPCCSEGSFFF